MNKQIYIQPNQTIWDVCLQEYGNIEHVYSLLEPNGLKIDDEIIPGQKLTVPEIVLSSNDKKVVDYYKGLDYSPASGSMGLIEVDNYIGLLDAHQGASVGYSMRHLVKDYNGACVRIRREIDNVSMDIGFVNHELDINSLLNFVGNSDGFVEIWYSQVGSVHLTQSVYNRQPKLVIGGIVNVVNGRYAIRFQNSYLQTGLNFNSDIKMNFEIHKIEGNPTVYHSMTMFTDSFTSASNYIQLYVNGVSNLILNYSNNSLDCIAANSGNSLSSLFHIHYQKLPNSVKFLFDNAITASKIGVQNVAQRFIIGGWNNRFSNMSTPEIIIYETDITTSSNGIYNAQNNYYNF